MASEGVLATLRAGWEAPQMNTAPKALIDGLALSVPNHARYTRDIDVLVTIPPDQVDDPVAALITTAVNRLSPGTSTRVDPRNFFAGNISPAAGARRGPARSCGCGQRRQSGQRRSLGGRCH